MRIKLLLVAYNVLALVFQVLNVKLKRILFQPLYINQWHLLSWLGFQFKVFISLEDIPLFVEHSSLSVDNLT